VNNVSVIWYFEDDDQEEQGFEYMVITLFLDILKLFPLEIIFAFYILIPSEFKRITKCVLLTFLLLIKALVKY